MRCLPVLLLLVGCAPKGEMRPPDEAMLNTHTNTGDSAGAPARPATISGSKVFQSGQASWYGGAFAGRKTANGERFDPSLFTAAHPRLPFGTWVEVRRIDTGRTVRVRVNDRGPNGKAARTRIIDLSRRAAEDLGIVREGVVAVELRIVEGP